ncbi:MULTISPECIES: ABC transporter permease [Bacillus]|jgi:putative spermidine/putrescine transport system permease protein|uniref:ABC transporter permease n=1 Tax=Bacillus TaxID=1386 RepID=UPI0007614890|nr:MULTISPECIES: ABC transporter permease [Bacillus]AOC57818.1 ABC transporter permease [Bacillus pumilus]AZV54645.1 ABC transporter permease [Bacillus pumilus]MBR0588089.1 ABC transporter permease [Bacillus pumilus DW2J2]MBR0618125.1 ABC transporter permease [Bacillus pumilus]MBR0622022.1 ABC transporter permease [Bacillus pumilus]
MRKKSLGDRLLSILIWTAGSLVYLFLTIPVLVIVLSAFSPNAFPEFPPTSFSVRWFQEVVSNPEWMESLRISVILLFIVTPLTVLLGTMASYALARLTFKGKEAIQAFILSPLMIPQVVLGIAMLYLFTAMGFTGSLWALVIGHVIIGFPYVVRTVGVSVSNLDPQLELASMNLGAGPIRTFFRVTLPLIKPGIIAGGVFSAVTSFGEISISLFVSSPQTITIPIRTFNYIEQTFDPSVNAISVIFIIISIIALLIIEKTIGLSKVM